MKVPYLKKKKMYDFAKQICPEIPQMKRCVYKFNDGSEWLVWDSAEKCENENDYIFFEMWKMGYMILIYKRYRIEELRMTKTLWCKEFRLNETLDELKEK